MRRSTAQPLFSEERRSQWRRARAHLRMISSPSCLHLSLRAGGATIETGDRMAGININHAARRAQFRFARVFMDGRLRLGLNPVVTYGPLRKRRVNFSTLVPPYRPLLSEAGLPR